MLLSIYGAMAQVTSGSDWNVTNITSDYALDYPYEITYGPDNFLWITEREGEKVVRANPSTGTITTMINLSSQVYQASGQDGLMGMAIHPDLYSDITTTINNYVFVAYTYDSGGRKLRIVRLLYNNATNTLSPDTSLDSNGTIIQGVPASNDHNSGRLKIGPDLKLYYTVGDQGNNQFGNACNPILAQVLPSQSEITAEDYTNYPGKLLRLELDGSIPVDNPTLDHDGDGGASTAEVQSHIYTYGHRNHQGLVFAADGTLYNSEHGPKVDDEINRIVAGGNYGWPEIAGYYDDEAYSYCNWSESTPSCNSGPFSDHNCPDGSGTFGGRNAPSDSESSSYPSGAPSNFVQPVGTYASTVGSDPSGGWLTWPTVAPSSIDIYEEALYPTASIPGWNNSLFITTLKEGTIFRAKLQSTTITYEGGSIPFSSIQSDGSSRPGYEVFHGSNDRYRDLAFSPDGLTMYVITDSGGTTSGPSGSSSVSIENPGVIMKIEFVGSTVLSSDSIVQDKFSIYPNPAKDIVYISNPNNTDYRYRVMNLLGKIILSGKVNSNEGNKQLNTSMLSTGIYIMNIQSENGSLTQKLIIE